MEYTLKDKIQITKEFLTDLEMKSWQEIEHLQNQIANIEASEESTQVIQLLKNLLTSYYVFAGGLENLSDSNIACSAHEIKDNVEVEKELTSVNPAKIEIEIEPEFDANFFEPQTEEELPDSEPFEYFVDFEEPVGEPLTDDDLYN